jgi:hypothetical protein
MESSNGAEDYELCSFKKGSFARQYHAHPPVRMFLIWLRDGVSVFSHRLSTSLQGAVGTL